MPKPPPPNLQTRPLLPRDIPSLAELLVSSPDDGSLYQYPHMQDHPDEMRTVHAKWLRPAMRDPTTLIRIAVLPQSDGPDLVVGFSSWQKRCADYKEEGRTVLCKLDEAAHWLHIVLEDAPELLEDSPEPETGPSKALEQHPKRAEAIRRHRRTAPPSPTLSTPCYELNGLAVHPEFQGYGIARLLVQWGLDTASEESIPVFATGETRGIEFYEKVMGFQRVKGSEYWLDSEGRGISGEEVEAGNEDWKRVNGGLSGAEMIWCPKGYEVTIREHVYRG